MGSVDEVRGSVLRRAAPPALGGNAALLVRARCVARDRSERDRRTVELSLTPAGRRVEASIWRAVARGMRSATGDLTREDRTTATQRFAQLRIRLDGPHANVPWEAA